MCHHDNLTSAHPPASCGCSFFVTCWCSSRSAAPDLQKLNEDGELWLVSQGLEGTIRCFPLSSMTAVDREERCSLTPSLPHSSTPPLLHQSFLLLLSVRGPEGRPGQAAAAVSF